MQTFEQITLGGFEWAVWGRSSTDVYLVSVKSVISRSIAKTSGTDYDATADFKDGEIDKYLNTKLVKFMCRRKVPYNAIKGPIEIFDVEQYKRIRDLGFVFPPIPEGRWWLQSHTASDKDETVSNYMLQVDNNGTIHKECGVYRAGVRAVMKVDRSVLNDVQRAQIEMAAVAEDDAPCINRAVVEHNIPKIFKRYHASDGMVASDSLANVHYYIVFCPTVRALTDQSLSLEVVEASDEQQAICTIPGVLIEYLAVGKEYVYVSVEAAPTVAPANIVADIKEHLMPQSLLEDRNFLYKLLKRQPDYWYAGYMLSTSEIPMSVVGEYQRALANS